MGASLTAHWIGWKRSERITMKRYLLVIMGCLAMSMLMASCADDNKTSESKRVGSKSAKDNQVDTLTITFKNHPDKHAPIILECERNSHEAELSLCDVLPQVSFDELEEGVMCTQQFGGAIQAHAVGVVDGKKIDTVFKRTDGCQIKRWDQASALIGPGVTEPSTLPR